MNDKQFDDIYFLYLYERLKNQKSVLTMKERFKIFFQCRDALYKAFDETK